MPSRAKPEPRVLVAGCFSPARNLRTVRGFAALLFQDGLLAEINPDPPLAGHVTGTAFRAIAASDAVRLLKGAVKTFYELLKRAELF